MNRFFAKTLLLTALSLIGFASPLLAHYHYYGTEVNVHIGGGWGWHHGWWHDRVYYTDPWYHPDHVYVYQGDPYAVYYYGHPYYYFDPRFYYYE